MSTWDLLLEAPIVKNWQIGAGFSGVDCIFCIKKYYYPAARTHYRKHPIITNVIVSKRVFLAGCMGWKQDNHWYDINIKTVRVNCIRDISRPLSGRPCLIVHGRYTLCVYVQCTCIHLVLPPSMKRVHVSFIVTPAHWFLISMIASVRLCVLIPIVHVLL